MSEFTFDGLRAVREVVRAGSFSVAAGRLGYTQSAVSRQVSSMERAAGRDLFVRHARGVEPTAAGRLVARHAETVLAEVEAAHGALQDLEHQTSGSVRLGAFSTALAALVPRALSAVGARAPGVEVRLREGMSSRLGSLLARGRLDLAVASGAVEVGPGVVQEALGDDPLFVAVAKAHRLANEASVDPDILCDEPWIAATRSGRTGYLGAWTEADWDPTIAYVVKDWTAKIGLVASGLGVTVVPGLAVPSLPDSVAVVRIDHSDATRETWLLTRQLLTAAASSVAEALRDAATETATAVRDRVHP